MSQNKWISLLAYGLIIAAMLLDFILKPAFLWKYTGLCCLLVALILAYWQRWRSLDALYKSHANHTIKTAWVLIVVPTIITFASIGLILLGVRTQSSVGEWAVPLMLITLVPVVLWSLYRAIKGLFYLLKGKAVTTGWL